MSVASSGSVSSVSLPPLEAISISSRPLSPLHVLTTPAHEPLSVPTGMFISDNNDSNNIPITSRGSRGRGRGRGRGGGRGSSRGRNGGNGDRFRGIVRSDPTEQPTSEEIADELGNFFENVEIKAACVQSVCPSISIARIRDRLLRTNGDVSAAISYFTETSSPPHPSHVINLDAPTSARVTSPDVLEIHSDDDVELDVDVDVDVDVEADDTNAKDDDEKHQQDEKHNKRKQTDQNSIEQQSQQQQPHIKRKKKKKKISHRDVLKPGRVESHDIDVVVIDDDD